MTVVLLALVSLLSSLVSLVAAFVAIRLAMKSKPKPMKTAEVNNYFRHLMALSAKANRP